MRRAWPFSQKVAVGVLVATVIVIVVLYLTHLHWYDSLKPEQRVAFINEALVAYGTLALAVVTWASVAETQQVLLGEDRRFRQSLMPVIKVLRSWPQKGEYLVSLINVGGGAARNIRIEYAANVHWTWNEQGTADKQDKFRHEEFSVRGWFVSSYLEPKGEVDFVLARVSVDGDVSSIMPNPTTINRITNARIFYQDVFGSDYETDYTIAPPRGINLEQFHWSAPESLIPRTKPKP